jgi:hypothetical protein
MLATAHLRCPADEFVRFTFGKLRVLEKLVFWSKLNLYAAVLLTGGLVSRVAV